MPEPMTEGQLEARTHETMVTMYQYINLDLEGHKRKTLIYLDESSRAVQFQGRSHVTPWHGAWQEGECSVVLTFDAYAGMKDHDTIDKTVFLMKMDLQAGSNAEYILEGTDYQGRRAGLKPIARWALLTSGAWRRVSEWSNDFQEWLALV